MGSKDLGYQILKNEYLKFLKKRESKGTKLIDKIDKLNKFYLPVCSWIYSVYSKDYKQKIIGLSGGQGTGKSTVTEILRFILEKKYNLNICVFSIDDFYKTKAERKKMSKKVHSLFYTRGVPGTHDVDLLEKTLKNLKKKKFKKVLIPKFDKSIDNRCQKSKWTKVTKPPSIIIFEGWCVGAKFQKDSKIKKSLNSLEKLHDANMKWRKKVNNELKYRYSKLFKKIDKLIYLKVPKFDYIFKWRLLQEKKLKLRSKK